MPSRRRRSSWREVGIWPVARPASEPPSTQLRRRRRQRVVVVVDSCVRADAAAADDGRGRGGSAQALHPVENVDGGVRVGGVVNATARLFCPSGDLRGVGSRGVEAVERVVVVVVVVVALFLDDAYDGPVERGVALRG